MGNLNVLVLDGDGIGPEVNAQALRVLRHVCEAQGITLNTEPALFGGASIDDCGKPVTNSVLELAIAADAVLLGAVGGPKWDDVETARRPERGLLRLRESLGAFANLRPAKLFPALADACPLKPEVRGDVDLLVVRELIGGIYFGNPRGRDVLEDGKRYGSNTLVYTEDEIIRIGRVAFEAARTRGKRLMSVDKSNVLESMAVWREVMTELGQEYPDVELNHMYVDNAAMQIIARPGQFDVIVTGNMFGDILSDAAAALTGSLGMLPSAAIGDGAVYEPVHGSAPDIAGQGRANPLAAILSAGMLMEHTAGQPDAARRIDAAVNAALDQGLRTGDIGRGATTIVGTTEMGDAVLAALG